MAEETQKTADPAPATSEAVSDVPAAEKASELVVDPAAAVQEAKSAEAPASADEVQKISESASFKEETNVVGELPDPQKKAVDELKQLVQEALNKHELSAQPPPPLPPAKEEEKPAPAKDKEEPAPAKEEEKPAPAKDKEEPSPAKDEEKAASAEAEEKPAPAATVPVEQPKSEEPKTEETAPAPPAAEGDAPPPPAEEKVPPPAKTEPETVVAEAVVKEKSALLDDDGAKTVEAIQETIVAVSTTAEPDAPPAVREESKDSEATAAQADSPPPAPEEVSIWGIPLLSGEKSDVVLLKFLRARDFKVKEAFTMLRNTVRWRKEFKIDTLLEEDLGTDLDKVVYIHGVDKEGHPVCYNAYGEFRNKELYQSTFADEEKREKFLRWRIQFLEKTIRKELDFSPDGISTFVQVNDLKASPGIFKREHRLATNRALQLLQDNYPELVAKQVFINVPWWYLAFYRMISPFFTQRTKSKFVFAGPSKSTETLFKYVAPERVPVQYGGLSKEGEQEFPAADTATEEMIKPATKHTVEFPVSEPSTLVWEARVIGWDVSYGAEFVPDAEGGYTVIIQKSRKIAPADETVISGSFKVSDAGKVVLTFDNSASSKKKKLLYRSKTKPSE